MHKSAGFWLCLILAGLRAAAQADERPLRDVIDARIQAGWQANGVTPAEPSDDAAFLRRVSLDLIGAIPTADEATAFLDDTTPDKRANLIDRLLADPRYAQHQADGQEIARLGKPRGGQSKDWLSALAISPDESTLAAADISGIIQVWRTETMAPASQQQTGSPG